MRIEQVYARDRLRRVDSRIWDGLLALVVLVLSVLAFAARVRTPGEPPQALGFALVVVAGVALAWRRRAPLVVAVIVAAAALESPGRPGPRLEGAVRVRIARLNHLSPTSASDRLDPFIRVRASTRNISDEVVSVTKCRVHWRFSRHGRRYVWRPLVWLRPGEAHVIRLNPRPGRAYRPWRYRVRCNVTGWIGTIPESTDAD